MNMSWRITKPFLPIPAIESALNLQLRLSQPIRAIDPNAHKDLVRTLGIEASDIELC